MSFNYKAPRLRLTYRMTVLTGGSVTGGTYSTKHQIWAVPASVPTPGQDPSSILVLRRNGSTRSLQDWAENYAFEAIRPRYRLGGGSAYGHMTLGVCDVDYLEENSDDATWIAGVTFNQTLWTQPAGGNEYATQLIVTFRTAGGRTAKLSFQHGRSGVGTRVTIPTSDAGIQNFVAYCISNDSCLRGIDGQPFIAGMNWLPGQNEALWKKFFRNR